MPTDEEDKDYDEEVDEDEVMMMRDDDDGRLCKMVPMYHSCSCCSPRIIFHVWMITTTGSILQIGHMLRGVHARVSARTRATHRASHRRKPPNHTRDKQACEYKQMTHSDPKPAQTPSNPLLFSVVLSTVGFDLSRRR